MGINLTFLSPPIFPFNSSHIYRVYKEKFKRMVDNLTTVAGRVNSLMFCYDLCSPVKYERIKFLVLALKNSVEVYAWAPKPYHKFMAFKVSQ